MTEGNPFSLILRFAVPLFIGNIFQQVYNMVDSIVVGRFVSSDALAAVGCGASPFGFFMTLIQGFTVAASVLISQAYGAGNKKQLRQAYVTSSAITLAAGIACMAAFAQSVNVKWPLSDKDNIAACEITVAIPAPFAPSGDAPSLPKIST